MAALDLAALLKLDPATLDRRIENAEFAMSAYQRQLAMARQVIEDPNHFISERERWIKESEENLAKLKLVRMSKGVGT